MEPNSLAVAAAVAAAVMYLSKSVWQLLRERRGVLTEGGNGVSVQALRLVDMVSHVLQGHAENEERILSKLVDLHSNGLVILTRIESELGILIENARAQAARMEVMHDNLQRRPL